MAHASLFKCADSPVFATGVNSKQFTIPDSKQDFGSVTMAKVSLCTCAVSPVPLLFTQNDIKSPFEPAHDVLNLDECSD